MGEGEGDQETFTTRKKPRWTRVVGLQVDDVKREVALCDLGLVAGFQIIKVKVGVLHELREGDGLGDLGEAVALVVIAALIGPGAATPAKADFLAIWTYHVGRGHAFPPMVLRLDDPGRDAGVFEQPHTPAVLAVV